jgi:methyl-accepting chemotaxis protein
MASDATAQSTAITQITAAISAMDQSTQQNAAMVEQTSAAARNLTSEVQSLSAQAAMFKLAHGAARRPAPPAAVHSPGASTTRHKPTPSKSYRSPVKPLPAAAEADSDDWNAF